MKLKNTALTPRSGKMRMAFAFLPLVLAGCFQNTPNAAKIQAAASAAASSLNTKTLTTSSIVYYASQVTAAPSAASSGTPSASSSPSSSSSSSSSSSTNSIATILVDAAKSSGAISDSCSMAAGKTCDCVFSWKETNVSGGTTTEIDRVVKTKMTNAQPYVISCTLPQAYATEIIEGTTLKINLIATGTNPSVFTLKDATLVKTGTAFVGDFQYLQGQAFDDVLRYTCHDMTQKGLNLTNKRGAVQTHPRTSQKVETLLANQFCYAQAGAAASTDCAGKPVFDYSSQAYYYNLYIRNTDRGNINLETAGFKCPQVKEPIRSGSLSVGDQKNFYPLDATFALALKNSNDFSVGVEAFTKISNTDAGSQGSSCASGKAGSAADTPNSGSGTGGLVSSCLGFAAKPSQDGTCPSLKDSKTGLYRNTYRLRRFIAVYPPIFEPTGKLRNESQRSDSIYVLDRPVNSTISDPLKPFTMRGPKPCPFAYFDARGVTGDPDDTNYVGGMPMYVGTGNPAWNGVNVDGTQFPNFDLDQNSCSAAMYLLNDTKDTVTIGTVHKTNPAMKRVYVRPGRAWTAHYEEDTSFQACAPQASDYRDPPLHFSKDTTTGNVSWCAEVYPTQNPNVTELDRKSGGTLENPWGGSGAYVGKVLPFTSHSSKNSLSATCSNTSIVSLLPSTSIYPTSSEGYHLSTTTTDSFAKPASSACTANNSSVADGTGNYCVLNATQTCDRTVLSKSSNWSRYPLLARPAQVEQSISSDSTYGCIVSYDGGNGKMGKKSPAKGCCGNAVKVWTGLTGGDNYTNRVAHLEPDVACQVPDYN